ncbi:MAG: glutamyl-Q tRNA(Asp) synthetase [Pseudoalteromonas tetraodonis]|jgi:glutamyl-Q tRNA(Asp) synthetase
MTVTRFAPSPTGLLHLGHAYAAIFAARAGERFLVRIEDIDGTRVRAEYEEAIWEDLAWLGLEWEQPVRRQSEHLEDYAAALEELEAGGFAYPCFCTRREIEAAVSAPHDPAGALYPGICRGLSSDEVVARKAAGDAFALRLDVAMAIAAVGELRWDDRGIGEQIAAPERLGDVVLARKDIATSYHLAVVVDDALQGVTLVTRGEDLLESTHVHRLLQELLGLPVPEWWHHRLVLDEAGKRMAKRDESLTLRALREGGVRPEDLLGRLGM